MHFNTNINPTEERNAGVHLVHVNHDQRYDSLPTKESYVTRNIQDILPKIEFNCDEKVRGESQQVSARGTGLNGFVIGEIASFVVDTSYAGKLLYCFIQTINNLFLGTNLLFVSLVTSHGQSDDVFVRHAGNGLYEIDYRICSASLKALITIKYGDRHIPGSPFTVYPN